MVAAVVTTSGIVVPSYSDILSELRDGYRAIYGADVYIEEDSQDGQLLALIALAAADLNALAAAVFSAFSPATAKGEGLSRVVRINGLTRAVPTNSSAVLTITGTVGTVISNGVARDNSNQRWLLPASVTIPSGGTIAVTALAESAGAVQAQASTITTIATPTRGWNGVNNAVAATAGDPVETDAALRRRQAFSTALPSRTVLEGLTGQLAALSGVVRLRAYENDTSNTDSNGVPPHSLAIVIEGGSNATIASTIALKKTIGTGTFGSTTVTDYDFFGILRSIQFSRPTVVTIYVRVSLTARAGYITPIQEEIKQSLVDYLTGLDIGDDIVLSKLYAPAYLNGAPNGELYDITAIETSLDGFSWLAVGRVIAYNAAATATTSTITLVVT